MKKILLSVMAIALTIGAISGSAYALFSDTVTVSGMTLSTGNADLQMSTTSKTDGYLDTVDFGGSILTDMMYPGYMSPKRQFWLKNFSLSPINLLVNARLTSAVGDWSSPLIDMVKIQIENKDTGELTGWKTLAEWNAPAGVNLPQLLAPVGDSDAYEIQVMVDSSADSTIAGKSLTNVTFVLTGTQN